MSLMSMISAIVLILIAYVVYKKIAEPISLYLVHNSIQISSEEYDQVLKETETLKFEIEKLKNNIRELGGDD